MKRFALSLAGLLSLIALASSPLASASSAAMQISQPGTFNNATGKYYETTAAFGVQYTLLATGTANFSVQLYQNGIAAGTPATTHSDPQSSVGNSGTFSVNDSDGTYTYQVKATCTGGDCPASGPTSSVVTVTVDTTAPHAPAYLGKTASGNSTTVKFTAPSDSDVTTVNIYAGSTKTYDADSSHLVATTSVNPGDTYTKTVNVNSSEYFAVEAFDAAGNGSSLTGDPGTVVHPVVTVVTGGQGNEGGAGGVTTAAAGTGVTGGGGAAGGGGQVQGATTGTGGSAGGTSGNVNAPGNGNTQKNQPKGKVLGIATTKNNNAWWYALGAFAALLLAFLYWQQHRKTTK